MFIVRPTRSSPPRQQLRRLARHRTKAELRWSFGNALSEHADLTTNCAAGLARAAGCGLPLGAALEPDRERVWLLRELLQAPLVTGY
ncbi:hypothetical protein V5799_033617 [Amblyomma americanum]|uniref:Uncharacterized protein n=1 Tax=Amblyomma americanum TaxID=6943 RepID=A0AAQ4DMT4_AMBAM